MNTKVAIVSIIGLVSVVGLLVGIYLVQQTQLLEKDASVLEPNGKATVTLNPATATISVDEAQDVAVMLNTGTEQIQGFEFVLNFTYSGESPIDAAVTGIRNINGTTWSYNSSLNTVTIGGGSGRIIIAGSIDSGSMSTNNEAITVANIKLTGQRATTDAVKLTFSSSNQENRVFSGTPAVDILTIPASVGTYTVIGGQQPTATPTQPDNTPAPTATGIPGLTPTTAPAGSTMSITYPLNNSTISTTKPTFRGTGPANSTIALDFSSGLSGLSGSTTANSTGSWSWTPTNPLSGGIHTATASNDANDDTASATFTITTSTGSTALPEAGSVETTILIAGLGIALLLIGSWLLI